MLRLALVADAFGEIAGALAANFDEAGIAGDLIQRGQGSLRFGEEVAVQVGLELQQRIVNAEAVVFHAAGKSDKMLLLARKSFKNLE